MNSTRQVDAPPTDDIVELCYELMKIGGVLPASPLLRHLSKSSARILLELRDGPRSKSELAKLLGIDKAQVSRAFDELRRDGDLAHPLPMKPGQLLELSERGRRLASEASGSLSAEWIRRVTKFEGQWPEKIRGLAKKILDCEYSTEPPNVRRGTETELAVLALAALNRVHLQWDPDYGTGVASYVFQSCSNAAEKPNEHVFLVADLEGAVYGSLLAQLRPREFVADILMLAVDYRVGGRGLGTTLVEELTDILRRKLYRRVEVDCPPKMARFFRDLGWREDDRECFASARFQAPYVPMLLEIQ